ncbi:MAG: hypothetical protein DVB31_10085 [Verrucomicrobia bacterium]|nr:MAG: hypothetical protein DVB31_10085 [Verrucomicrobiota bacterium]
MRRLFRPTAAAIAAVALALWFFGGPNLGRSEWYRDNPGDRPATGTVERQFVFRPGLDFLGASLAVAIVLGWAGRKAAE